MLCSLVKLFLHLHIAHSKTLPLKILSLSLSLALALSRFPLQFLAILGQQNYIHEQLIDFKL